MIRESTVRCAEAGYFWSCGLPIILTLVVQVVGLVLLVGFAIWWWREDRRDDERSVLRALSRHPGGVYGLEIQKEARMALGSLFAVLGRLCERGLVTRHFGERVPDTRDMRRTLYRITDAGRASLSAAGR